jgi:hypothetical protein
MIQLQNRRTDFDEIWYGRHAIDDYPKIVLSNFLQSTTAAWRTNQDVMCERQWRHGYTVVYDKILSETTRLWSSNSLHNVK